PTDCFVRRSINKNHPAPAAERRSYRPGLRLTKSWPGSLVTWNRDRLTPFISSSGILQTTWFLWLTFKCGACSRIRTCIHEFLTDAALTNIDIEYFATATPAGFFSSSKPHSA